MEYLHEAFIDGHKVALTTDGKFLVDGKEQDWYKDSKTGKPWLVRKRGSFIGLVKQILRDE